MVDFTVDDILIPADHPCFEGHFPDHPVFPAVAQIDLLTDLLCQRLGQEIIVTEIRKAKFPAPILPNSRLRVQVHIQDNGVTWQIAVADRVCSSGWLQLQILPGGI